MNFSECCLPLSKACKPNLSSQAKLVCGIFCVLGSKFFSFTSNDYPRSVCTGKKPLTDEMKRGVSCPFKTEALADFFFKNISNDKIEQLKTAYGFSADTKVKKNDFCLAIARQLQLFFGSDESDVENIILEEYEHIQLGDSDTVSNYCAPLYPGDEVQDYSKIRLEDVNTYQKFFIEIDVMNTGSVPWVNRRLVYQRPSTSGPLPVGDDVILLPKTVNPKESFRLTIEMDARGSEGDFQCRFEMQDSDGNNCFPEREKFDYRVNVVFALTTEQESKMADEIEKWVNLKDMQEYLGVGRETILQWISKREMPAYKIGMFWKFKLSEVDDWVRSGGAADIDASKADD